MKRAADLCLLSILMLSSLCAFAQMSTSSFNADRQRALELYSQNRFTEAVPLLEKLAGEHPEDVVVQERLGCAIYFNASGIQDPERRKQERLRARQVMLRAKELGDNSDLLQTLLASIPPDGNVPPFSTDKQVEETMRQAEAAFQSGDMLKAVEGYTRALALDPKLYVAAVYCGDTFFKMKQYDKAGEWFARAIQIDPDKELAYRYWGDALMPDGRMSEARARFIDAIVAEPYSRTAHIGLQRWAQHNKVSFTVPRIQSPNTVKPNEKGITLNVDPTTLEKKDGSSAWLVADMSHMLWQGEKFLKEYPNEKTYRHSLKEESERLHLVASSLRQMLKDKEVKSLDPNLAALLKLEDAGLVEAYILVSAADQGIVQDYIPYRNQNRDKLHRYLDEFVVPKL